MIVERKGKDHWVEISFLQKESGHVTEDETNRCGSNGCIKFDFI